MVRYYRAQGFDMELVKTTDSRRSFPLHNHVSVYTVGLVLRGSITLICEGTERALAPGTAFFIPPYLPHGIVSAGAYSMASLCVKQSLLGRRDDQRLLAGAALLLGRAFPGAEGDDVPLSAFRRAIAAFQESPNAPKRLDARIERLRDEIEASPERSLSTEDMAKRACQSRYHFIRRFKAEVGLSPHQFQLQNRIRKAQRLLARPIPMAQVALSTGFCDQSHFIRQFEKVVGIPPSAYRAALVPIQKP